jgi:hypothetical protein
MKIYLSTNFQNTTSKVTACLDRIGVEYTADYNEPVDGFFYLKENDEILLDYTNNEIILTDFMGHIPSYIADKCGLSSTSLTFKHICQEKLRESNLPYINSVYPTTEQDIIDFFASNGVVICKPIVGEMSQISHNVYMSVSTRPTTNVIVPAKKDHFYKIYNSYAEFETSVDINEFLNIQNSNYSLCLHKCLLQKVVDTTDGFRAFGCVNGAGEVYFYPIVSRLETDTTPSPKLTWDFNVIPDDSIITRRIRNPEYINVDRFGIHDIVRTLLNSSNVKNTFFDIEGVLVDDVPYIYDMAIQVRSSNYNNLPQEIFDDHMKFVLDLQPSVTLHDEQYSLFFFMPKRDDVEFNQDLVNYGKTLGIMTLMLNRGWKHGTFMARADSIATLMANLRLFWSTYN